MVVSAPKAKIFSDSRDVQLGFGDDDQLALAERELDAGIFQIIARRDLATHLIHDIHHFLPIIVRDNVEGALCHRPICSRWCWTPSSAAT